jgi:phosphoribosylglycinamide formyltransferase-1
MPDPRRVAVLISGRGSNMKALVRDARDYEVVLVASNKPGAPGLEWARDQGLPTWARDSKGIPREQFDAELGKALKEHAAGTIALAGYMRLLSPSFVEEWRGRILNIHPSLLPKYRGLDTHARAIAAGDPVSGCTVHVVTEELDAGEILGQAEVPVEPEDTPRTLEERIRRAEHQLYPKVLAQFVRERTARP